MAGKSRDFQPDEMRPGMILHDAIIGAFRANGDNFSNWCDRHGIAKAVARNATFGQSRGSAGTALLNRMIDAAGRNLVVAAYGHRLKLHAEAFAGSQE